MPDGAFDEAQRPAFHGVPNVAPDVAANAAADVVARVAGEVAHTVAAEVMSGPASRQPAPRPPARFGAVITAMVTPFGAAGELDLDGAVRLARWLASHGSDGLAIAGSTGEGPSLDDSERTDLFEAVKGAVTIPVLAATGTAGTAHSIEMTQSAQKAGVDGILLVTPYYLRPSQSGLANHFRMVAAATNLPILLYDIPSRTGRKVAAPTLLRLAEEVPNIVGVKDAAGDAAATAALIAEAPPGFELYSGDDSLTLPLLSVGAVGVISVASHWAGETMLHMVRSYLAGEVEAARVANASLVPSYAFESSEVWPNPLPAKAACRALGLPAGQCRPPLGPAGADLDEQARSILAGLARL